MHALTSSVTVTLLVRVGVSVSEHTHGSIHVDVVIKSTPAVSRWTGVELEVVGGGRDIDSPLPILQHSVCNERYIGYRYTPWSY